MHHLLNLQTFSKHCDLHCLQHTTVDKVFYSLLWKHLYIDLIIHWYLKHKLSVRRLNSAKFRLLLAPGLEIIIITDVQIHVKSFSIAVSIRSEDVFMESPIYAYRWKKRDDIYLAPGVTAKTAKSGQAVFTHRWRSWRSWRCFSRRHICRRIRPERWNWPETTDCPHTGRLPAPLSPPGPSWRGHN